MLDLKMFRADPKATEEGTWAKYLGAEFLIAKYNNDAATQLRSLLSIEKYDVLSRGDDASVKAQEEINARVMSETVLLDWKNTGFDGKEVKYTKEIGYKIFIDPAMRDFAQFVENYALNRTNYQTANEIAALNEVKPLSA